MHIDSIKFLNILLENKDFSDFWFFPRDDIPSDKKVTDYFYDIQNECSDLKNISLNHIIKDKVFIHHKLFEIYYKDPLHFKIELSILEKIFKVEKEKTSLIELVEIARNSFYPGRNDFFLRKKLKEISKGNIKCQK